MLAIILTRYLGNARKLPVSANGKLTAATTRAIAAVLATVYKVRMMWTRV